MATTKKTQKKSAKKAPSAPAAKPAAKATSKPASKPTSKKGVLAQAKAMVDKALKKTDWKADLDTQKLRQSLPHLPTGSMMIDHLIGGKQNEFGVAPCPGLPKGKIFNLYGHEGSGKTTLALTVAAETIRNGGIVCYIDWENEIVPQYAKALGVPIGDEDRFILCQPETLEEGCSIFYTMAAAGVDLIVLDSVGAGVPKADFEKSIKETADQGRIGGNAAVWSRFLPKIKHRVNKTGTTVIAISQLRDSINAMGYGDQFTVQGGKAWRFFSTIRMHLKAVGKDKIKVYSSVTNTSEDKVVGVRVRARLEKCKVSPQQGNEEHFYIRWGKGIDDMRSLMEIGLAHKIIRVKGSWFYWTDPEGNEKGKQGLDKLRVMFEQEPELFRAFKQQVLPHMASEGAGSDSVEIDEEDILGQDFGEELEDVLSSIADSPSKDD
jgi:recombination protein RecA